jgi:hypothetical protein
MYLVIACALVGPAASSAASLRAAASNSSSSKIRLTTPQRSISSALKIPPDITKWRARPDPARSASRCVPPIDGVSPTTFSTRPNFALGEATIRSQASESSKAAVRVSAWAPKTTGAGSSSTFSIISSSSSQSARPCSGVSPANT